MIFTLGNQKGGVGKTTTVFAMSSGLSNRGNRVLAIDLDPQCNLTLSSGIELMDLDKTLYDVFRKKDKTRKYIVSSDIGFDLLPGGLSLAGADMDFTQTGREYMLQEAISDIQSDYDYIIIDTPPTLGILTVNALTASDYLIIPMMTDVYSIQGLSQLSGMVDNVRKYCNSDLRVAGFLITKFHERQLLSKALLQQIDDIAGQMGTKVFETRIRESVAVREAALLQSDIFREAPKANATVDYNQFIDEIIRECK